MGLSISGAGPYSVPVSQPITISIPDWALTPRLVQVLLLRNQKLILKELDNMSQEINDLRAEIAKESEEDVLSAQTISELNAKVEDLQGQLDQVDDLVDAAKQGEAEAIAQLEAVLAEVRQAVEDLRADNPDEGGGEATTTTTTTVDPNAPRPDQTLPGDLPSSP